MALHKVLQPAFVNGSRAYPGDVIEYDGPPVPYFELVKAQAPAKPEPVDPKKDGKPADPSKDGKPGDKKPGGADLA